MPVQMFDYDSFAAALSESGIVSSLSEVHGGICGVMCVGGFAACDRWLERCIEEWQVSSPADVEVALRELEGMTWRMLSETDMAFEPLLPGEDETLDTQVRALALWCHGFLTGLGFGGLESPRGSETLDEITRDFAELSRAALSDEEAEEPEQSGFALAELKEYVRVSVQLVFEQFDSRRAAAGSDRLH